LVGRFREEAAVEVSRPFVVEGAGAAGRPFVVF
jgi:hypothetical protein